MTARSWKTAVDGAAVRGRLRAEPGAIVDWWCRDTRGAVARPNWSGAAPKSREASARRAESDATGNWQSECRLSSIAPSRV